MSNVMLVIIIVLAICFDFINGFHDTANSIATSISTRALSPRVAILLSSVFNLLGACAFTGVAMTISHGLVSSTAQIPQYVIMAAIIGAIIWDLVTWFFGIPSSSSHALIGSLVGSVILYSRGIADIEWNGVFQKVILPLLTSPVIGFLIGYIFMKFLFFLLKKLSQKTVNTWFSKLQIISAGANAFAHGSNDAQKSMGIITMALISAHSLPANAGIPFWVKLVCAIAMALGTSIGGWRIIKTVGFNMIKLQPIGGFAAQTSATAVILAMTAAKAPVSTTHVITTSIMGVGASKRLSSVRWSLAKNIVLTWIITIPATVAIGALVTYVLKFFY